MTRTLKRLLGCICVLTMAIAPQTAAAYDWSFEGYVTTIEPTYAPASVFFQSDAGMGSCPAGTFLLWGAKGADASAKAVNIQAVLSALLTAQAAHRKVRIFGNNLNCSIDFIHIL